MDQGIQVQISEMVAPDTVFTQPAGAGDAVVIVNPLNYSYLAYEDPFEAHAINMRRIYAQIKDSYFQALARLDAMVDEMNRQNEPKLITFLGNAEVAENPDGSFTFSAQPTYATWEEQQQFRKEYEELKNG